MMTTPLMRDYKRGEGGQHGGWLEKAGEWEIKRETLGNIGEQREIKGETGGKIRIRQTKWSFEAWLVG